MSLDILLDCEQRIIDVERSLEQSDETGSRYKPRCHNISSLLVTNVHALGLQKREDEISITKHSK